MSSTLLSTPSEAAYRLLLALSIWPTGEYTARWMSAVDFISEYGFVFGVSDTDLHGDNGLKFTEYVVRIETVDQALRKMALNGWVTVTIGSSGYTYRISQAGYQLAENFQTSYAHMYRQVTEAAYKRFGYMTEWELDAMINRYSVESASKENLND